jgi:hypothetical protein
MRNLAFLLTVMLLAKNSSAQIQVSKEPRHHNVFENQWVRILDVHIPPHDTSIMHKHSTPSVFMVLSNTKTGSQVLIEPGKPSFSDGNIWFEGFYDKPRVHRVWNEDTVEFHVIDMELLHPPATDFDSSIELPFSKRLFDEKPVRAFRLTLPPKKAVNLQRLKYPLVIVGLSGPGTAATVNGKAFTKKGDFLFIAPGNGSFSMSNLNSTGDAQFAVFVLK